MPLHPDFDPAALEQVLGGPVELCPVAGGQSNPTWFVTQGSRELVLRKKPDGATLSSAHAVDREYRVMKALAGSGVPVPEMVLFEEDPAVLGTPYYLMERLSGSVSESSALPDLVPDRRRALYHDAARVLARLHRLDWRAVGLEGFGKTEGYYARQVVRWGRQWEATRVQSDRLIEELATWFAGNVPEESPAAVVHGDYRIGNLIYETGTGRIAGVLDWELSTLGDPMADLAHWMMFYRLAPDQLGGLAGLDLDALGIPGPSEFLDRYRAEGGSQGDFNPFHRAFAFYRMAVIFEGITARAKSGQASGADALEVGALAPVCARLAAEILSKDTNGF
ncbi:phosphotransferase family protein [Salipiger abyssi]|uniref:phosphotransferase family protein n=1 Tax=Salipiger abyssi TaxID=1250539 RepID=UPI004057DA05